MNRFRLSLLNYPKYLDIRLRFNKYNLGWMNIPSEKYYPTMIFEFYESYLAFLENHYKKGQSFWYMIIYEAFFCGVSVDIFDHTINYFFTNFMNLNLSLWLWTSPYFCINLTTLFSIEFDREWWTLMVKNRKEWPSPW